jgi:hypothetical protein
MGGKSDNAMVRVEKTHEDNEKESGLLLEKQPQYEQVANWGQRCI